MKGEDLPLSFCMALSQNETAMKRFKSLSKEQKNSVIDRTHGIKSKAEMQSLVNSLSNGSLNI